VADAERRKSLLERILNDIATAPMMDPTGSMGMLPPEAFVTREDLRALTVEAVMETAERGQVVIVSHAAGIPLTGRPDLLRVLVTASFELRAQRVAEATRSKKADAEKSLKDSDAGRADYFLRFYRIERELPTYHVLRPSHQHGRVDARGGGRHRHCRCPTALSGLGLRGRCQESLRRIERSIALNGTHSVPFVLGLVRRQHDRESATAEARMRR
jgi:hypothetical protein